MKCKSRARLVHLEAFLHIPGPDEVVHAGRDDNLSNMKQDPGGKIS